MKPYLLLFPLLLASFLNAATVSPLFSRGYTALPSPQKVTLGAGDFVFSRAWRLDLGPGVKPDDMAVTELKRLLAERFQLVLQPSSAAAGTLRLAVAPQTVQPAGKNGSALAEQAYRLTLTGNQIALTGNTSTGLFYGIGTLVQLLKARNGQLWLPEAQIDDWPDLELRIIYWDDAHHLEPLDVLKAALRQASFFKINGFALKLEGHFQFAHAQPIVEPYALSPAQLQELTDYGLQYHVQVIPYLDGPAHDSFILKHPEYADLREYPASNYEFCSTNPKTYQLLEGMFADLLAANRGGKYFVLSTDEPYYVGLAHNSQCDEASRATELGSVGKLLAEFITKTASYLHAHGRQVIFWGEYPLKPADIASLPPYLINGEVYGPQFDPVFKAHGIRQMVYTYTEAEEQLFPQYYILPSSERVHPAPNEPGRVESMLDSISFASVASLSSTRPDSARPSEADVIGVIVAGWGDAGLHPETFWLGYAAGPSAGWHPGPSPQELQSTFYSLFYGSNAADMGRLYQLMSEGAQFWQDSWETGPSSARTPIFGNSFAVFNPPQPARDQYLPPLPVPSPDLLHLTSDWRAQNRQRLMLAGNALARNDELFDLLQLNAQRVQFGHYNLQVFLSLAAIYRQNLTMLQDLGDIADALQQASTNAGSAEAQKAVTSLDHALDIAQRIREQRNQVLKDATATWSQSWLPRVAAANGRAYLDQVDDVKDHQPVRTVDMSYLVYRELLYPLEDWASQVAAMRNQYAHANHLPARDFHLNWRTTI